MELDVRGHVCPYPAAKAKEALESLPAGENLVVITDHAPALSTVPWEGAKLGFAFTIVPTADEEWRIELVRSVSPLGRAEALAEIARAVAALGVE